jgi:crotonobetainyl-CoA:carnitine CoA-transferase CaiB-like acyl-CoA transferase
MSPTSPSGPLAGTRVIDLTMAWAGPMATRVLAQLGADVIKVEAAGKMDRWRGGTFVQRGTERYPDHEPTDQPWNRNAYFNTQNVNKRSLVLDLKSQEGHEIILDLVRQADVVTENFAFGAMGRLGLDYDTLAEVKPGLVMLSMPGFGSSGPERNYIAHGPTI